MPTWPTPSYMLLWLSDAIVSVPETHTPPRENDGKYQGRPGQNRYRRPVDTREACRTQARWRTRQQGALRSPLSLAVHDIHHSGAHGHLKSRARARSQRYARTFLEERRIAQSRPCAVTRWVTMHDRTLARIHFKRLKPALHAARTRGRAHTFHDSRHNQSHLTFKIPPPGLVLPPAHKGIDTTAQRTRLCSHMLKCVSPHNTLCLDDDAPHPPAFKLPS
ncbi:hypothetical protein HYPSUDRAFT_204647 [Hypholoma sublateritium FD-334 SS-4]|uniref:Uncharacterized protein n=1 Tax=Hypholoma sublateritium (strain FD-334 SS-4) TaxID=945553 RepID=A0A0D2NRW3_HYPSF|nr:hypothetical protein HYPSUDRAFT_204647 [Hypholoma sublateritium FD-334 SS-4]